MTRPTVKPSIPALRLPIRVLKDSLKWDMGLLADVQEHLASGEQHTSEECGCVNWRRRTRNRIASLKRAIEILESSSSHDRT